MSLKEWNTIRRKVLTLSFGDKVQICLGGKLEEYTILDPIAEFIINKQPTRELVEDLVPYINSTFSGDMFLAQPTSALGKNADKKFFPIEEYDHGRASATSPGRKWKFI